MKLLSDLKGAGIHIKDETSVLAKLTTLIEGGSSSLQVISDFDLTLSRFSVNNVKCPSSHGILESGIAVSAEAREQMIATKEKYYAIEIDPHMTVEEKIPYMLEWWGKTHEAMGNLEITKPLIKEVVAKSNATLKDGCSDFFKSLHDHSIPLLIFSAGLGDVIEEVIHQKSIFYPNMKLVSNFMEFNQKGNMVGFKGKLIHTFNKNEGALGHSAYFEEISHRHNIILLGDMMGDLKMSSGIENINTLLTIGYLNKQDPVALAKYMDRWDIVIVEDHTVNLAKSIISKIVQT